jgi:hypothetical protein
MFRLALGPTQPSVHWVLHGGILPWVYTDWGMRLTTHLHLPYIPTWQLQGQFYSKFFTFADPVAQIHQWKVPSVPQSYTIFLPFKITTLLHAFPWSSLFTTCMSQPTYRQPSTEFSVNALTQICVSVALTEYKGIEITTFSEILENLLTTT